MPQGTVAAAPPSLQANAVEAIGVVVSERIYAGRSRDHSLEGKLLIYPNGPAPAIPEEDDSLTEMHTDALINSICGIVMDAAQACESEVASIGVALPGLIRNGIVEEAPNLPQLKGARMAEMINAALSSRGISRARDSGQ